MRALVLPGLDGTGKLLADFVEALEPGIAADVATYPRDVALDYDELLLLVERRMPRGTFLLIGESFSGPIAIRLAAKFPERVVGLVLCASFAISPRPWLKPFRRLLDLPLPIPRTTMVHRFTMGRWSTREWRVRAGSAIAEVQPDVVRRRLADALSVDASADLPAPDCPLLYLQASEDRLVPKDAWTRILERVPGARLAVIEGPHFLLQIAAGMAAEAVRRFADDIQVASRSA